MLLNQDSLEKTCQDNFDLPNANFTLEPKPDRLISIICKDQAHLSRQQALPTQIIYLSFPGFFKGFYFVPFALFSGYSVVCLISMMSAFEDFKSLPAC
jgi:hypothetical protein